MDCVHQFFCVIGAVLHYFQVSVFVAGIVFGKVQTSCYLEGVIFGEI